MGQKGFFDIAQRYAGLDAKNDPLARIDEVVPWEDFRPRLEAAWRIVPAVSAPVVAFHEACRPRNGSRRQGVSPGTRW